MQGLVILIMGLAFAGVGSHRILFNRRLGRRGERVHGVVVELHKPSTTLPNSSGHYYPVLSFCTREGQRVQTVAKVGSDVAFANPGQHVRVLYDPANPSVAEIDTAAGRNNASFALAIAVGACLITYATFRIAAG